jgi:hypothetical protein
MVVNSTHKARGSRFKVHKYRLLAIGVLLSIGGYFIISAGAINVSQRVEAESNALTGASGVGTDAAASGSHFVQFGTNQPWTTTNDGLINVVTDPSTVFPVPSVPEPGYLSTETFAPFNTKITRITGDPGTSLGGAVAGTWSTDARHHYSKDQPWNSDQSLIAIQNTSTGGGNPSAVYLDATTHLPAYGKCSNYQLGDDRWHVSTDHPHERVNATGTLLDWFDITTCTETRQWTLPMSVIGLGQGEGNTSFDGRFAVLGDQTSMFVVDMDPQPPYAPYPTARFGPITNVSAGCGLPNCKVTWESVSPSGKYAVVHYSGEPIKVFDIDPVTLALTPRTITNLAPLCPTATGVVYKLGHADMTLNPFDNNEDVIIGQEKCGNLNKTVNGQLIGHVVMVRLKDGTMTSLTNPTKEQSAHHISARNFDRPGWAYVSYFAAVSGSGTTKKYNDEIIAVKLDGSGSVERLANMHSTTSGCYRCETHAVPSRDGTKVMYASTWSLNCDSGCGGSGALSQNVISGFIADAHSDTSGCFGGSPPLSLPNNTGSSTSTFHINATDTYKIWSRVMVPDTTRNSYWLQIDNGCPVRVGDSGLLPTGNWTWVDYQDGIQTNKTTVNLTAGTHTVKFVGAESGILVDEILATNDPSCVPVGIGDNCASDVTGGGSPGGDPGAGSAGGSNSGSSGGSTSSSSGTTTRQTAAEAAAEAAQESVSSEQANPTSEAGEESSVQPPPRQHVQVKVPATAQSQNVGAARPSQTIGLLGGVLSLALAIGLAAVGL